MTRAARSIGLVPGKDSPACFFLEPLRLPPGHTGRALREALSRWVYDPFKPPAEGSREGTMFGYTVPKLAHICRASQPKIEHAVRHRVFGAVTAIAAALRRHGLRSIRCVPSSQVCHCTTIRHAWCVLLLLVLCHIL